MKTSSITLISSIVLRLQEQAKRFNPALETAPMVVLWTDERRDWEGVLPNIKSAMPELFALGEFNPGENTGPGAWLRMVADRKAGNVPAGVVPVIYLPGVANGSLRTDLRTVRDDPQLAPVAELQYRGNFWRQDNGKDWTVRAFFESKRSGLGLTTKGDQQTLAAFKQALPKLLSRSLVTMEGRTIDLAFLDEVLNPNPADDVLRWLADPHQLEQEKGDAWPSFVASSRQRYGIDLSKGPLDTATLVLAARESDAAYQLWQKFVLRPSEQAGLYDLFNSVPKTDLLSGAERYPRENEADEKALAHALKELAKLDMPTAADRILSLEVQHAPRRATVWASLGKAPLAEALVPLATVARAVLQPAAGGTVSHQAAVWAASGWKVDAAAMAALALAQASDHLAAIEPALVAVYRPWLQGSAEAFQQRVASEGYPPRAHDTVPDGTVVLFVDGLRLDLARQLESAVGRAGFSVELKHRFTSVPSVTSSGKVWCSPGYAAARPAASASGFEPILRVAGSDGEYTADRLRRAIEAGGFVLVDPGSPGVASGRGWAEFADDIDSDGHKKGLRLAEEAPRHVAKLFRTIERLLGAGWQRVRVVTDHGWLLLPGGLPKVELPANLAETKWARCAVLKEAAASIDVMSQPWSFGAEVRIALAPGIGAFRAGQVYDHGGLTLQECVVPMLDIVSDQPVKGRPAIKSVTWNTRKTICSVEAANADAADINVERLGSNIGDPGVVDAQGKGRVVFEEIDDLLGELVSVVLRRDGLTVAQEQLKFGEAWHAA